MFFFNSLTTYYRSRVIAMWSVRVKVEELGKALIGAGRKDLAEDLNNKYRQVHMTADKKLRGDWLGCTFTTWETFTWRATGWSLLRPYFNYWLTLYATHLNNKHARQGTIMTFRQYVHTVGQGGLSIQRERWRWILPSPDLLQKYPQTLQGMCDTHKHTLLVQWGGKSNVWF